MIQFARKQTLSALVLLLAGVSVFAQQESKYVGLMQVGPYVGKANYRYLISDKDTVFDGPFQIQKSSLEALLDKKDTSFLFKGNFDKGVPNGNWQFQFGEFKSDSQSKVVDYEYRVLISGMQQKGVGAIIDGSPNGKWTYRVNRIKDSEIENVLFASEFIFDKGVAQQNFKVANEKTVLVGRFLRSGLAQDEWTSYTSNQIDEAENWYFDDGVLRKIVVINAGVERENKVFGKTIEAYRTVHIDDAYLALVQVTTRLNGAAMDLQDGIAALLTQNAEYYEKMETVLLALGSRTFSPKLKVKVPYYPLDSVQLDQLNRIAVTYSSAKSTADALLNNSHLNIIKRSDPEALFNYNAAAQISKQYLNPLETLFEYNAKGILEYLEIPVLIEWLWPNGKPSKQLEIDVVGSQNPRIFTLPEAVAYGFETNDLNALEQLTAYAKLSLEKIRETLSDKLTNEEHLQTLNDLEEDLIAINMSMVQQIDSASDGLPNHYKKALGKIKTIADASLSEYASINKLDEKLKYGKALKGCFEQFDLLIKELIHLPSKMEEIKALYLDAIWNPFMATVMNEEVKKRISTAYSKILVPHFIESVEGGLQCENAKKLINQISHTNTRMITLREEDTRKLERKLRKEKNPEEIMKLFGTSEKAKDQQE